VFENDSFVYALNAQTGTLRVHGRQTPSPRSSPASATRPPTNFRAVSDLHDADALSAIEAQIDGWLASFAADTPGVRAIDRHEGDEIRWYVRMAGEEKDFTTVWLTLGQRTLRYETYVMPAPEERAEQLYEHLLRRNDKLVGAHFSIGLEDAVYLRGELPLGLVCEPELDRALGTLYATVEQCFRSLLRIGFASRFTD
jgi:hypothetical protein